MIEPTVVNRRYRVDRPIGEGGMAVVYRGHDLLLGRDVAIKALRPQFAADAAYRLRFEREAQAAAGFTHPNIIDIYDVGEEAGTPYIVMAFVRGQSLKEIIATEAPFHPDDVAALLDQLCSALDYAHERGYVHRDVKPQNVLIDEEGQALVVDFGIAKGLADSDLTEVGGGLGTVHYLSPEQASGLMATPASDVYAAGVVAFEMLTGHLPFAADSPIGVAMRHIHDPPPAPSAIERTVPAAVDAIVLRALAKDPTRRFATAGAFARAMGHWRRDDPSDRAPGAAQTAILPVADERRHPSGRETPWIDPEHPPRAAVAPRRDDPAPDARRMPTRPQPTAQPRPQPAADGDHVGCTTWLAGSAILLGLIGLIWLGVRLSDGPGLFAGADDPPLATAAPGPSTANEAVPPGSGPPAPAAPPTIRPTTDPPPAAVAVPQLIGLDQAAAEAAANGRGFVVSVGEAIPSEAVPAGLVAEQAPRAESNAAQGETIVVRLSAGSTRVDLAALELGGQTADDAETTLRERGLAVERNEVASADVPVGAVVSTDPGETATVGQTVTLGISVGDLVRVPPEIQGQPLDQVERQLTELGFRVRTTIGVGRGVIEEFDVDLATSAIDAGDVVGIQAADPVDFGDWVPPGTEVDLVFYDPTQDTA